MASTAQIGQRRSYDGALCTVRYIGDVFGTSGSWLGVEWDDPSRGKHDGQHKGVRYFSCTVPSPWLASSVIAFGNTQGANAAQAKRNPRPRHPSSGPRARQMRPSPSCRPCTSSMPGTRLRTKPREGKSSSRARSPRRLVSKRSAASRPSSTSCSLSSSMASSLRIPMRRSLLVPAPMGMTGSSPSVGFAQRSESWT